MHDIHLIILNTLLASFVLLYRLSVTVGDLLFPSVCVYSYGGGVGDMFSHRVIHGYREVYFTITCQIRIHTMYYFTIDCHEQTQNTHTRARAQTHTHT
jgi:hypothetical protein